jgi:uncharacterized protein (TIGR03067 family)
MRRLSQMLGVVAISALAGLQAFGLGALAAPAAPAGKDKPGDDLALLQGSWDWDPAAKQMDLKPQVLLERVVIKGDTLTLHYSLDGRKFKSPTEFKIYPGAAPKRIDFTPTEGANKGQTYLGLYDITDGKLRICYRGPESTRPKDFDDTSAGNNVTVFIALVRLPVAK